MPPPLVPNLSSPILLALFVSTSSPRSPHRRPPWTSLPTHPSCLLPPPRTQHGSLLLLLLLVFPLPPSQHRPPELLGALLSTFSRQGLQCVNRKRVFVKREKWRGKEEAYFLLCTVPAPRGLCPVPPLLPLHRPPQAFLFATQEFRGVPSPSLCLLHPTASWALRPSLPVSSPFSKSTKWKGRVGFRDSFHNPGQGLAEAISRTMFSRMEYV